MVDDSKSATAFKCVQTSAAAIVAVSLHVCARLAHCTLRGKSCNYKIFRIASQKNKNHDNNVTVANGGRFSCRHPHTDGHSLTGKVTLQVASLHVAFGQRKIFFHGCCGIKEPTVPHTSVFSGPHSKQTFLRETAASMTSLISICWCLWFQVRRFDLQ